MPQTATSHLESTSSRAVEIFDGNVVKRSVLGRIEPVEIFKLVKAARRSGLFFRDPLDVEFFLDQACVKENLKLPEQNYSNHRQTVPLFHFVLLPVLLLTLIGSAENLYMSWGDHERLYSAALIVVLSFCGLMTALFCRVFALKAQDRAIRAEENLRHFALTGKLLDPRISIKQIVALRFAPDDEFADL